jgi:hypothetical protein
VNLINYILRQFFKALEKDTFLAVEVSLAFIIIHPILFDDSLLGLLPEKQRKLETVFQLGATGKRREEQGRRRDAFPSRSPGQERIFLERPGWHCYRCFGRGRSDRTRTLDPGSGYLIHPTCSTRSFHFQILQTAKAERERIIEEVDKKDEDEEEDLDDAEAIRSKLSGPSLEAQAKMTDYRKCLSNFSIFWLTSIHVKSFRI